MAAARVVQHPGRLLLPKERSMNSEVPSGDRRDKAEHANPNMNGEECPRKPAEDTGRQRRPSPGHAGKGTTGLAAQPIIRSMADVEHRDVKWMWERYIPLGMVSDLQGDPGLGKS